MITSETCLQKFKDSYRFRLDAKTIDLYQRAVGQLLTYCEKPFDEITTRDIRNWLLYLETNQYNLRTVKNKLAGVKLFYKYCLEEGIITHNPVAFIPFPEVEDSLPHYLEVEQLEHYESWWKGGYKKEPSSSCCMLPECALENWSP